MKIDNDIITMDIDKQSTLSNNIASKSSSVSKINKLAKDKVDLSISGKTRGINSTVPIRKVNTAGLIITDLKISRPNGEGPPISFEKSIATVSNERATLRTSENRLGGNTRSIDKSYNKNIESIKSRARDIGKAKEMMEQIKQDMLNEVTTVISAQGNSNPSAVLHLLR